MWNLLVFAVIGLLVGAAVRSLYPGRQSVQILSTIGLGVLGGVLGGVISWLVWSEVDAQFQSGNLIFSVLGAFAAIGIGAAVVHARSLGQFRKPGP